MSDLSPLARSLGLAALLAVLLTACGTSATMSPAATSAAATPMATDPAATSAALIPAQPTIALTEQLVPTTSATIAAVDHTQHAMALGAELRLDIKLFMFNPAALDVKPGTTLIWTNQDAIDHSVTAGMPGSPSGAFDSDFFGQAQTFKFTFNQPGTYDYFCKRHESMIGKINVTAP